MKEKRVKLINVKLPRIINKVAETLINRSIPGKSIYLYRNLLRFDQYTDDYKQIMEETLEGFNTYKNDEKEEAAKYNILPRTHEDQE